MLDRLAKDVVHEICTNQVVVTLHACVKELVENSLDAGASRIEVRLRENGSELLEVVDDGCGISSKDFANLATRHATSKIRGYDDLSQTLNTFGFRGEALSAICAMGEVTVCTRTATDATAVLLSYDRFGTLVSESMAAREVGTTVSVRDLFARLPVRHREFLRNAKAQVSTTLKLLQAYAIVTPEIRFHAVAEKARGSAAGRATLLSTSGTARGWLQAAAAVLGDAAVCQVIPFELPSSKVGWAVSGLISTPLGGRRSRDTQLFFCNRRPIDPPKRIIKLINDTFHQYNSRAWPVVILSFTAGQSLVDVNVTPDKRTVFLHSEEALLGELQAKLNELYAPVGTGSIGMVKPLPAFGIGAYSNVDAEPDFASCGYGGDGSVAACPIVLDASADTSVETRLGSAAFSSIKRPGRGRAFLESEDISQAKDDIPASRAASDERRAEAFYDAADVEEISMSEAAFGEPETQLVIQEAEIEVTAFGQPVEASSSGVAVRDMNVAAHQERGEQPQLCASISLATLQEAVARRQRRHADSGSRGGAVKGCTVSFPSAFSLAALQGTNNEGPRPSLEDVAKFNTESAPWKGCDADRSTDEDRSSSGIVFDKQFFTQMRVVGQFNLGFIIAALRTAGGLQLFIVDQHASDEKVRFEFLNRESKIEKQPLVSPLSLQLTPAQEQLARDHLEVFRLNGFTVLEDDTRQPGQRLRLSTLPTCQGMVFSENDVHDLLFTLEESESDRSFLGRPVESGGRLLDVSGHRGSWSARALPRPRKVWQLLACRACRGATMIGKAMKVGEMERALRNLGDIEQPWNCPHGRPTMRHLVNASNSWRSELQPGRPPLSSMFADEMCPMPSEDPSGP